MSKWYQVQYQLRGNTTILLPEGEIKRSLIAFLKPESVILVGANFFDRNHDSSHYGTVLHSVGVLSCLNLILVIK